MKGLSLVITFNLMLAGIASARAPQLGRAATLTKRALAIRIAERRVPLVALLLAAHVASDNGGYDGGQEIGLMAAHMGQDIGKLPGDIVSSRELIYLLYLVATTSDMPERGSGDSDSSSPDRKPDSGKKRHPSNIGGGSSSNSGDAIYRDSGGGSSWWNSERSSGGRGPHFGG